MQESRIACRAAVLVSDVVMVSKSTILSRDQINVKLTNIISVAFMHALFMSIELEGDQKAKGITIIVRPASNLSSSNTLSAPASPSPLTPRRSYLHLNCERHLQHRPRMFTEISLTERRRAPFVGLWKSNASKSRDYCRGETGASPTISLRL